MFDESAVAAANAEIKRDVKSDKNLKLEAKQTSPLPRADSMPVLTNPERALISSPQFTRKQAMTRNKFQPDVVAIDKLPPDCPLRKAVLLFRLRLKFAKFQNEDLVKLVKRKEDEKTSEKENKKNNKLRRASSLKTGKTPTTTPETRKNVR
jgi:hypothetical protein